MAILISGSLAYDYIMDFPDSFKNHILPDQIHILSVSFVIDKLQKHFGGTAGNIAYTAKLLDAEPIVFGALGSDAKPYLDHFKAQKIDTKHIQKAKKLLSSSAYITTDKDDNQITAFYPGAGREALKLSLDDVKEEIDIVFISPADKDVMVQHAKQAYDKKIPIVFDPGQQITALDPRELCMLVGQATFFIGNDYEMKLMHEKTGWDIDELFDHVEVVITTLGSHGSKIQTKDTTYEIKPCTAQSVDDPTGAGDAYRAGFFSAYVRGMDLRTCGQVASVAATYAVENYGTQAHDFALHEFENRYQSTYGEQINL